jgi:tetratricopeptide (TPR) repeat protein
MAGVRPFLMFTYWLNRRFGGESPASYHIVNLLIHAITATLVFLVLYRLLSMANWEETKRTVSAAIGAAVFLVHPLQTESVSYIAGRSESLASMFVLLGYVVFLYRAKESISWRESVLVFAMFAIGMATKENTIMMAGLLMLTDVFWPVPFSTRSLRGNWRLYALMLPGCIVSLVVVFRLLVTSSSAGFSGPVTWYQYGFTQARALFTYLRLALLPIHQSIDHDFPVSRTIWEYGAAYYLLALGALIVFCVWRRRSYPLACFGLLITSILLAPTSSIVPISDPVVERRMYLPLVGLILIACEVARRVRISPLTGYGAAAGAIVIFAILCYQRNQLWSDPSQLWAAAAMQSVNKIRPYMNLVDQLIQEGRCGQAIPYLRHAEEVFPNNYGVQVSWGRTLECVGRRDEALQRLLRAAAIQPGSYVFQLIGLLHSEMGDHAEAGRALQKAVDLDPKSVGAHNAFGLSYEAVHNPKAAERQYRASLALDPNDLAARAAMARVNPAYFAEIKASEALDRITAENEAKRRLDGFRAVSLSPSSGSSSKQVYTAVYFHPEGPGKIKTARILINQGVDGRWACYVHYDHANRTLSLINDLADGNSEVRLGTAGPPLENGQCQVDGSRLSATEEQGRLTVVFPLTFKASFAGPKEVYLYAEDVKGAITGFKLMGTWKVP